MVAALYDVIKLTEGNCESSLTSVKTMHTQMII